ncbi:DUF4397 domain-containing protein [Rhizobacter sp. Root404]|uniref:DUF4397 domain-containing protein n=1 Tax=Rhizobacter sp. Root404 TaxID=1736528 RepID=UPI000701362A|nr:DUF4397 domain-containing protein [Rhizobacter sp. Root404]KQW36434.1 hypothetical protein ASC76_17280 [Rhizobacter sp. Root404]
MKLVHKLLLACIPLAALAACGGGDTEDRLDVADPVVRFVHAAPAAPNVTLYRAAIAQPDATNVMYQYASNYFDVDLGVSDWSVKTAVGGVEVGTVSIDPQRGTKYTIVALQTSATSAGTYLITDPYNKALTSDSTHLRVMNASYNAASVDVYMNTPGTDIATVTPKISGTAFNAAGPATGNDSADIPGGTYQVTVTSAGTKTVLFKGQLSFANNQDLLILTVPDASTASGVSALVKVEGTAGATPIAAI